MEREIFYSKDWRVKAEALKTFSEIRHEQDQQNADRHPQEEVPRHLPRFTRRRLLFDTLGYSAAGLTTAAGLRYMLSSNQHADEGTEISQNQTTPAATPSGNRAVTIDTTPDRKHRVVYRENQPVDSDPLHIKLVDGQILVTQQQLDWTKKQENQGKTFSYAPIMPVDGTTYSARLFTNDNPHILIKNGAIQDSVGTAADSGQNVLTLLPLEQDEKGNALVKILAKQTEQAGQSNTTSTQTLEFSFSPAYASHTDGLHLISLVKPAEDISVQKGITKLQEITHYFRTTNVDPHAFITPNATGYTIQYPYNRVHKTKLGLVYSPKDFKAQDWEMNTIFAFAATMLEHQYDNAAEGDFAPDIIANKLIGDVRRILKNLYVKDAEHHPRDSAASGNDRMIDPAIALFYPGSYPNSSNFSRYAYANSTLQVSDVEQSFASWMVIMRYMADEVLDPQGEYFYTVNNDSASQNDMKLFFTACDRVFKYYFPDKETQQAILPRLPELEDQSLLSDQEYERLSQAIPQYNM